MKNWLLAVSEYAIVAIDAAALAAVLLGTLEIVLAGIRAIVSAPRAEARWRDIWIRYGRWLVLALTFQLAADIIETSITTSWMALGRLAAVAVIRTLLNYFLERDLVEVVELRRGGEHGSRARVTRMGRSGTPCWRWRRCR